MTSMNILHISRLKIRFLDKASVLPMFFTTRSFSRIVLQFSCTSHYIFVLQNHSSLLEAEKVGGGKCYVCKWTHPVQLILHRQGSNNTLHHSSLHSSNIQWIHNWISVLGLQRPKKKKKKSSVRNFPHEKSEYWYRKYNYKNRMRTSNKHVVLKLQNDLTVAQIRAMTRADHSLNISQMNKHIMTLFWGASQYKTLNRKNKIFILQRRRQKIFIFWQYSIYQEY